MENFILSCKHCGQERKNENSLRNHERLCKNNVARNLDHIYKGLDKRRESLKTKKQRGTAKNQWDVDGYQLKDSTRQKLSASSKKQSWDEQRKQRHSAAMKNAVSAHPDAYTSSNRGRTKQIIYDEIKFQGKWELEFYQYCKTKDIMIERSNEWFEYEWNGTRKYFPDFFLPEKEMYIEVKGYETERDRAKWNAFPKKLTIVRKQDIIDIRKGIWDYSSKVEQSTHNGQVPSSTLGGPTNLIR